MARITVPGPAPGASHRKTVYGRTREEAFEKMTAELRKVHTNVPIPRGRKALGDFLEEWLEGHVRLSLRRSTYNGYRVNVRRHIVPVIGTIPLPKLAPKDIERLLATLAAPRSKKGHGLSPRSVQYVRATLHAALEHALRWELVARNVVDPVKGPRVERAPVNPLTPKEVTAFLEGVRGDRLEGLYVTAFTLGLRQGELLGLRWQDVDLDHGRLRVVQALRRGDKAEPFGPPKSSRGRRAIAMPEMTRAALRAWRVRQAEERLAMGAEWQDTGLVFTTTRGTPLDGSNVNKYFQRELRRLELPRQRFHDARHGCASLLIARGVPLRVVMEILGHSQISITADTYAHVFAASHADAAAKMDEALSAASGA